MCKCHDSATKLIVSHLIQKKTVSGIITRRAATTPTVAGVVAVTTSTVAGIVAVTTPTAAVDVPVILWTVRVFSPELMFWWVLTAHE